MVAAAGGGFILIPVRPLLKGLLPALWLASAGVAAQPTAALGIQFEATPGTPVSAWVLDGGGVAVQVGTTPQRQQLDGVADADGHADLDHEDVDFDGAQDLVVRASVGQVNEAVAVYRYDAASGRFEALDVPSSPRANCDGLWSLSVDAASRSLVSTCRGGPMWYTDIYRYAAGALYLYRAEELLQEGEASMDGLLQVERAPDAGPLAVWRSYDAAGDVLESAIGDGLVAPAHGAPLRGMDARVVPARLPLHRAPGDTSTKRYLLRGDVVELLDARDGWTQLRYRNPSRGAVLGWVGGTLP